MHSLAGTRLLIDPRRRTPPIGDGLSTRKSSSTATRKRTWSAGAFAARGAGETGSSGISPYKDESFPQVTTSAIDRDHAMCQGIPSSCHGLDGREAGASLCVGTSGDMASDRAKKDSALPRESLKIVTNLVPIVPQGPNYSTIQTDHSASWRVGDEVDMRWEDDMMEQLRGIEWDEEEEEEEKEEEISDDEKMEEEDEEEEEEEDDDEDHNDNDEEEEEEEEEQMLEEEPSSPEWSEDEDTDDEQVEEDEDIEVNFLVLGIKIE